MTASAKGLEKLSALIDQWPWWRLRDSYLVSWTLSEAMVMALILQGFRSARMMNLTTRPGADERQIRSFRFCEKLANACGLETKRFRRRAIDAWNLLIARSCKDMSLLERTLQGGPKSSRYHRVLGRLFGYPSCCIKALHKHEPLDAAALVAQMPGHPLPFVADLIGLQLCSAQCRAAQSMAVKACDALASWRPLELQFLREEFERSAPDNLRINQIYRRFQDEIEKMHQRGDKWFVSFCREHHLT